MRRKSVAFIASCSEGTNEFRVINYMYSQMKDDCDCRLYKASLLGVSAIKRCSSFFVQLLAVFRHDVVIVHSPLIINVFAVCMAAVLRKRLIALVWDLYPVNISGVRYDDRFARVIADNVEQFLISRCSKRIVPSKDFLTRQVAIKGEFFPIWHPVFAGKLQRKSIYFVRKNDVIRIGFAGQINATRGLHQFIAHLNNVLVHEVELHIFSADIFAVEESSKVKVVKRGSVTKDSLQNELSELDFGLVSLNIGFENPAFPSKTFDYLAAGLPVIYFGKVLPHYIQMLYESNVGFDCTGLSVLDLYEYVGLRKKMYEHALRFEKLASFDRLSFDRMVGDY